MRRSVHAALAFGLAGLLAGCGSPPPPPAVLSLAIAAGPDQNPDTTGKPAPVAVHVYQLAGTAKFERADVFALIEQEKPTLGDSDVESEEFVVKPGEKRTLTKELKPATQFVGVAVLFRDIDHATWRVMAPVARSGPTNLALTTKGTTATLAPAQ